MTRARRELHLYVPVRYYHRPKGIDDAHGYGKPSRFFTDVVTRRARSCGSGTRACASRAYGRDPRGRSPSRSTRCSPDGRPPRRGHHRWRAQRARCRDAARAGRARRARARARAAFGGAAVSISPFPGVDARLSRYAYLVSLFPGRAARAPRRRRGDAPARRQAGPVATLPELEGMAERVFATLTEPLRSREDLRRLVGEPAWSALFEAPAVGAARARGARR